MEPVVLLTVDCLRRDHVGCYGYDRPTTPNVDRFADSATAFRGFANCPGTRWAFQALHTGVFTDRIDHLGVPSDYEPLAERFRSAGYATAGFVDNGWVSRDYGYDKGFDEFFGVRETQESAPLMKRIGHGIDDLVSDRVTEKVLEPLHDVWLTRQPGGKFRPPHTDEETVSEAMRWVEEQSDPYFLWIHFMMAHTPYGYWEDELRAIRGDTDVDHTVHPGEDGLVTGGQEPPRDVIDTYDACVRYVDSQIGRVIERVPERATIVVTGDHGEEFGRYGEFHEASLHHSMTDVPLIVRADGVEQARRGEPAQHVDVPPTLLTAEGIPVPDHWDGEALQETSRAADDPILFSLGADERAVKRGDWKLIDSDGEVRLFERVGGEEIERASERGPADELTGFLADWPYGESVGEGRDATQMSSATEENLEDLGYL